MNAQKRVALIARRRALGLSQQQAAERAGIHSVKTYQRWDSGETTPSPGNMRQLALALEVSVQKLQELLDTRGDPETATEAAAPSAPAPLHHAWTNDVADAEAAQLIRDRFGETESLLVYKDLSVAVDIQNPRGDAKITYVYDVLNCGSQAVFGEMKSIWFENPSPDVQLSALASPDGVCSIKVRRDYENTKHFYCAFPQALRPGETVRYGFAYQVPAMFTQNHYWDQIVPHLTRRLQIGIRHHKRQKFSGAHIESESRFGVSVEPNPNIAVREDDGTVHLSWAKDFPTPEAKYSLHWAFVADA